MRMNIWIKIKKINYKLKKYVYTFINRISFWFNGVKCGSNLATRGRIYIYRHYEDTEIIIGDNVNINSAYWANPIGFGDRTYFQVFRNGKIIIGNKCGISNAAFSSASSITLGDEVMIGAGCKIYDTDFHAIHSINRGVHGKEEEHIKTQPIFIEDHVFIGAGTLILKGVHIGKHSVIGAGSVVTHDVPEGEIWAGSPARFVKKVD